MRIPICQPVWFRVPALLDPPDSVAQPHQPAGPPFVMEVREASASAPEVTGIYQQRLS